MKKAPKPVIPAQVTLAPSAGRGELAITRWLLANRVAPRGRKRPSCGG